MIRYYLFPVCCLFLFSVAAQDIKLTPQQIETIFLRQNLELIADQMNISIADAAIAEAKVWDNPEFSIGDLHVWSAGHEKQFSVELTQMVSLSARRSKLANVEKVGKEIAIKQFEELLRGLKAELRYSIAELYYLQNTLEVIEIQQKLIAEVIASYQIQFEKGNVARSELVRLQTALFAIESDINDTHTEINAMQKTLKNLLALDPSAVIVVADETRNLPAPQLLDAVALIETALSTRPDLQSARLQSEYHQKDITYQRSLVMPDIGVGLTYDRFGGVWDNFFGVGLGLQIPIFNRNKGAIKTAQIRLKQSELFVESGQKTVQNEVIECFQNYAKTYAFLERSLQNPALKELDDMMEIYTRNLIARNIQMVEYMDFIDSYRSTKEMLFKNRKELKLQFEQLQFVVGQDIRQ